MYLRTHIRETFTQGATALARLATFNPSAPNAGDRHQSPTLRIVLRP
jgi:hypothetical protein